jgi:DNA-binding response OmpR family regulator
MARITAVVPDLMLSSRVTESLKASGHEVTAKSSLSSTSDLPDGTEVVVCDLDTAPLEVIAALDVPVLGFYSHVDVDTRRRALDAGLDKVVPRSRMARELPDLVGAMLRESPGG